MKTPRLLLAALPLLFLAASALPRHQAFGLLRFGMSANEAAAIHAHMNHRSAVGGHREMTAAEARAQFVTNGGLRVARMPEFEAACPIAVTYKAEPVLSSVTVSAYAKPAENYDGLVKQIWEDFQDIGDCKFQRKGAKGVFPPMPTISAEHNDVITDTWETEGVRIELYLHYFPPVEAPGVPSRPASYMVMLKAAEIAPPAAK